MSSDPPSPTPKPGRPRSPEPGSVVSIYLTAKEHDRLIAMARQERMSLSALVRALLAARITGTPGDR